MAYKKMRLTQFFATVNTEERARRMFWRAKFNGKAFECPRCHHERYYEFKARSEVRRCRQCDKNVRVRAGTALAHSKKSLLIWARMIFLMMQDKRGVSALQVKRELGMKSYGTVWGMLHKVRRALANRDERYSLSQVIELDGAEFKSQAPQRKGRRPNPPSKPAPPSAKPDTKVLIAIESKEWVDDKGRTKQGAGFAKVMVARETKRFAQDFVEQSIEPGSTVNTDGGSALINLTGIDSDNQIMNGEPEKLSRWLPWTHRFISNAKAWMIGTHHGIKAKYLPWYLAETTYRFNRRHDPDGLCHRALTACALAPHTGLWALTG